jgi:hypothetical protein
LVGGVADAVGVAVDTAIETMRSHEVRHVPVFPKGHAGRIVSLGDLAEQRDRRSVLGETSWARTATDPLGDTG